MFNATFHNILAISWRPVLVVEEAGENYGPWDNWSTLSLAAAIVHSMENPYFIFFSSSIHVYFLAELSFSNAQRSLHILYLGVLDDLKHARGRDKFIFRPHQIDVKFFVFFGASNQN